MNTLKCMISACCMIGVSLSAQSSVWKITKEDHSAYMGGTCHLLRASDYPLPVEFDAAYEAADKLVFEVAPADLQAPAFAMQMMAESVYKDGRTLKSVLSPEAYAALAEECSKANMPIEMIQSMKPSMAVMMLTIQKLMKAGVSQEGVDIHYGNRAASDNKPVAALETAQFQLNLITNLGNGVESELVLYSLQDLDQIGELFDQIIAAWRSGNLDTINQLFIEDMAAYTEIYNAMLKDRNARWLPQIETMLATDPIEFILVGVAHMAGEDGLVKRLEARGYTVTQVNAD